jgi:hypothetical protein
MADETIRESVSGLGLQRLVVLRDISSSNRQPEPTEMHFSACIIRNGPQLLFLQYISPSADVTRLKEARIKHPYTKAVPPFSKVWQFINFKYFPF